MTKNGIPALFVSLMLMLLVPACAKKGYLERGNEDAALRDAVRKITKNPADENAADAIPVLYKNIKTTRLARIQSYSSSENAGKWDDIINEYEMLQQAYVLIINSAPAFRLVTPESYSGKILEAKNSAADYYYVLGTESLLKPGRSNAKKAYDYFKKAGKYIPDYKDAELKCIESFNAAMVRILINPIKDYSGFSNSITGLSAGLSNNETFVQNLLRDLGGKGNTKTPAAFYSQKDIRKDSIQPDWAVDLSLKSVEMPSPQINSYSRSVNKQIQIGTDTAGRPEYQTVYATINILKTTYSAKADMEVLVKDLLLKTNVRSKTFTENFRLELESATFAGDRRALGNEDWNLINNQGAAPPSREYMLGQLYVKMLPGISNMIFSEASW